MKWQQIVDLTPEQFNKLSKSELKGYTQVLASAGNKRIKRAQEQKFDSPSIQAVLERGKFSTKDKNLNQLRNEFMRAKRFLESKTGTLGEFKKWRKENIQELKEGSGINLTEQQFDVFWRSFEQLKKEDPTVANMSFKYHVLSTIDAMQKDNAELSVDEIVSTLKPQIEQMYKEHQSMGAQADLNATELDIPF